MAALAAEVGVPGGDIGNRFHYLWRRGLGMIRLMPQWQQLPRSQGLGRSNLGNRFRGFHPSELDSDGYLGSTFGNRFRR